MEGMIGVVFQSAYSASDGQFQESAMLAAGRVGNGKGGWTRSARYVVGVGDLVKDYCRIGRQSIVLKTSVGSGIMNYGINGSTIS